jgi:hypothetical protein
MNLDRQPEPVDEGYSFKEQWEALKLYSQDRFGFSSLKQARQWFYHTLSIREAIEAGCLDQVSVYKIEQRYIVFGQFQVVFDKRFATLVERKPLEVLLRQDVRQCVQLRSE